MSEYLLEESPAAQMRSLAFLLGELARADLSLTPEEVGAVSSYLRRQAEVRVLRPRIAEDVAAGLVPQYRLDEFDAWAPGYVGDAPKVGAGERQ